jgi:hypothetical protein
MIFYLRALVVNNLNRKGFVHEEVVRCSDSQPLFRFFFKK